MKKLFRQRSKTDILAFIWQCLGIAIILFFIVFSFFIKGDALSGYTDAGRYFVSNHGDVTEVSKTIWILSKISGILFIVFIPLTPIGCYIIYTVGKHIEDNKNKME